MNRTTIAIILSLSFVATGASTAIELAAESELFKLLAGYDEAKEEENADRTPITPGPEVEGVTSSRWDDTDRNRIYDELDDEMRGGEPGAIYPVIVLFNERPQDASLAPLKEDVGEFTVRSAQLDPDVEGRMWNVIPAFATDLSREQVAQMATRPDITHIELDGPVATMLSTATVEAGADKASTDFGVNGDRTGAVRTYGAGDIVICVIDTGIYTGHYDLNQGQVIGWADFVGNQANPYDNNGHGTHVASIAAGQGDGNVAYRGVAQGAALVGVKVLNGQGAGSEADIVDGIDWCSDNEAAYGIEIITLSLGGGTCTSGNDAMSAAVNAAWNNGIVVTVAAGNSGPGYCTVASPGSAANVITVGAMSDPKSAACTGYKAGGWYLGDYSSRGATGDGRIKPEISAPGTCITAARAGYAASYTTLTGTSMATPFVAGTVALMLDCDPNLTPANVKSMIMTRSQDWGPDNQAAEPQSYDYGAGRLQVHDAVEDACNGNAVAPGNPSHYFRSETLDTSGNSHDDYTIGVTTTSWRIAISTIIPSASANKDFDVRLYKPDGTQVATSLGTTRQETISYVPTVTGNFKVRVESYTGTGSYWIDVSAGANAFTLSVDQ